MSESTEKKNDHGCMYYIVRLVAILVVLNTLFWLIQMGFQKKYPPTPSTQALVPFQNNYLAFTDSFITDDLGTLEFTTDPGPISRLIFSGALVLVIAIILLFIVAFIPGLNRFGKYITQWFFILMMLVAAVHASFIPSTLTVFNQKEKQLELTNFSWGLVPIKKTYPFFSLKSFSYKLNEDYAHDHSYTIYAQLFAEVGEEKIFLSQNVVGWHGGHQKEHDAWKLPKDKQTEIENAIQSMRQLTGLSWIKVPL